MTGDEREAVRSTLVVIDAIHDRSKKRLVQAQKLIKEAEEILADIPHRKAALYTLLDMQDESEREGQE